MGVSEVTRRVVEKSAQISGDGRKDEGESTKRSWSRVEETQKE